MNNWRKHAVRAFGSLLSLQPNWDMYGAPLPAYEADWNRVMNRAAELLGRKTPETPASIGESK